MHVKDPGAHLGQPTLATTSKRPSQPLKLQQAEALMMRALPNTISRRLDDMLSTPFRPHIIHYEPSSGFVVPKFMMYDEMSDPFDHIMHFRQLMTLDIGNSAMMCKVFSTSLHDQALSWFHRLSQNSVNTFQDVLETFVGHYLCFACPKAKHKHFIEHQVAREQVIKGLHEVVQSSSAPSGILQYGRNLADL